MIHFSFIDPPQIILIRKVSPSSRCTTILDHDRFVGNSEFREKHRRHGATFLDQSGTRRFRQLLRGHCQVHE